jgi:hypothetical protein
MRVRWFVIAYGPFTKFELIADQFIAALPESVVRSVF